MRSYSPFESGGQTRPEPPEEQGAIRTAPLLGDLSLRIRHFRLGAMRFPAPHSDLSLRIRRFRLGAMRFPAPHGDLSMRTLQNVGDLVPHADALRLDIVPVLRVVLDDGSP
ncbi:MAG TPA: hypothetical protein VGK54_13675 [Chloroflexota bacterium]